jgi:DNA-binding MarR family transcriptional regulator
MAKEHTQKELSGELSVAKQNINKICKDLISMDFIEVGRTIKMYT